MCVKVRFFDVFKGYRKWPVSWNGFKNDLAYITFLLDWLVIRFSGWKEAIKPFAAIKKRGRKFVDASLASNS